MKSLRLVLLYALLLGLALFAGLSGRAPGSTGDTPSVNNAGPRGLAVLFTYLTEGGSAVEAWREPLTALPARVRTLVLAAPRAQRLTRAEVDHLEGWVSDGGTLLYLPPDRGELEQPALTAWLGLSAGAVRSPGKGTGPLGEAPLTALQHPEGPFHGLHALRTSRLRGLELEGRPAVPVARVGDDVFIWALPLKRGEVYLIAGSDLAENRFLESGDNLAFWQAVAARGPLAFDETHLLPAPPPPPSRALNATLLQLAVLTGVVFWARGIRLGPARVRLPERHRSSREYLDSFGWLLRRARVERELARALHGRVRRHLWEEAHIPLHLSDDEAALQWAAQTGQPPERLLEWAAAASASGPLTAAQFARLTREAAALESVRRSGPT